MRAALLALALILGVAPALAQPAAPEAGAPQPAAPAPVVPPPVVPPPVVPEPPAPEAQVRATLTPAQVVVGQPATLVIEVLAPNYMTKPPVMPEVQIANAITRAGSTMNFSERQADVSFAGIRYTFLLVPQEAGTYAVPGQTVTVTYADNPPHTRVTAVPMPATHFEAVIPDAARALAPFLSATRLSLSQEIQRSSPALKVGDSVTRIVTIAAEGAPAILLPPTTFAPIPGARVYASQPQLSDGMDRDTGVLSSTRADRAVYMLEAAGTFTLPAIDIAWWDAKNETVQHARLEPQSFAVAPGASGATGGSRQSGLSAPRRVILFVLEHWLAVALAIAAIAVLIWATPPVVRDLRRRVRHRRAIYRQSEACAFRDLSRIAGQGDPRQAYRALLTWLTRFEPAAPAHTVKALNDWARDPILAQEIGALERRLFSSGSGAGAWSDAPLMKALRAVRRKAEHRHWSLPPMNGLPEDINPEASHGRHPHGARPVAR